MLVLVGGGLWAAAAAGQNGRRQYKGVATARTKPKELTENGPRARGAEVIEQTRGDRRGETGQRNLRRRAEQAAKTSVGGPH